MDIIKTQLHLISQRSEETTELIDATIRQSVEKEYYAYRVNKVLPPEEKRI